jgi:folate-binding protein YgfZ
MHFPLTPSQLTQLTDGAVVAMVPSGLFRIEGPGALDCLQGLLTNDLAGRGTNSLVYGGLLTPKGMIVVDGWVLRLSDRHFFLCDASGRERAAEIFRRSLPPRLARVTDLSDTWSVLWVLGKESGAMLGAADAGAIGDSGRVTQTAGGGLVAIGTAVSPFEAIVLGAPAVVSDIRSRLVEAGAAEGDETMIGAAMVLAGWPALGREIEERTLPQEVRFDELEGVSYSKGCYTGQETVARIHFRGHVNRVLRGIVFEGEAPLADARVTAGGKEIGTVHSSTSAGGALLGLSVLRREVGEGDAVLAGERTGRVVALPFSQLRLDKVLCP